MPGAGTREGVGRVLFSFDTGIFCILDLVFHWNFLKNLFPSHTKVDSLGLCADWSLKVRHRCHETSTSILCVFFF